MTLKRDSVIIIKALLLVRLENKNPNIEKAEEGATCGAGGSRREPGVRRRLVLTRSKPDTNTNLLVSRTFSNIVIQSRKSDVTYSIPDTIIK